MAPLREAPQEEEKSSQPTRPHSTKMVGEEAGLQALAVPRHVLELRRRHVVEATVAAEEHRHLRAVNLELFHHESGSE